MFFEITDHIGIKWVGMLKVVAVKYTNVKQTRVVSWRIFLT